MAGEDKKAGEQPAAKSKKGKLLVISLISVVVLGGGAWFAMGYLKKKDASKPKLSKEEEAKLNAPRAPKRMPVPLLRDTIVYFPKVAGNDSSYDMIISTNAKAARYDKIIVTLADTKRERFAVARISLIADDTNQLIEAINENQPKVYDSIAKMLSLKTVKDIQTPAFRNLFRMDVMNVCNKILGTNLVREVLLSEFMVQ
jgi:flagellar basal body-associated protein FliL